MKDSDVIESVKFELDETFKNPERVVSKAPFQLKMKGWGILNIPIEIKWKKHLGMTPTRLEHYLSFSGGGKSKKYKIKIHKDLIFGSQK